MLRQACFQTVGAAVLLSVRSVLVLRASHYIQDSSNAAASRACTSWLARNSPMPAQILADWAWNLGQYFLLAWLVVHAEADLLANGQCCCAVGCVVIVGVLIKPSWYDAKWHC